MSGTILFIYLLVYLLIQSCLVLRNMFFIAGLKNHQIGEEKKGEGKEGREEKRWGQGSRRDKAEQGTEARRKGGKGR